MKVVLLRGKKGDMSWNCRSFRTAIKKANALALLHDHASIHINHTIKEIQVDASSWYTR